MARFNETLNHAPNSPPLKKNLQAHMHFYFVISPLSYYCTTNLNSDDWNLTPDHHFLNNFYYYTLTTQPYFNDTNIVRTVGSGYIYILQ